MNEHDIPIDIHIGKLLDWLISRRIVSKNWNAPVRVIRNKIGLAVNDMPEHPELLVLLAGAHINYFHCLQIVEILKTTEADTKGVFGNYGSRRMKDWQEILKLYEKDNLYLAEGSQIFVRNLTYEIPSLKKQITKFDQLSDESQKKIQDSLKTETILFNEHHQLCQQLRITGDILNVHNELVQRITELPNLYAEVTGWIPQLQKGLEIYTEFCGNQTAILPLIKYMTINGNTTVFQYVHNRIPLAIEEPPIQLHLTAMENPADNSNIDFDVIDDGAGDGTIDFDMVADDIIDFGNDGVEDSGIHVEATSSGDGGDGTAKNHEAYSILDSTSYREQFIDEILELKAFLSMRIYELNSLEDSSTTSSFSLFDGISTYDVKTIQQILDVIIEVHTKLTSEQIQHLHYLKHSPKYGQLLVGKLTQKLNAIAKLKALREMLKEKIITYAQDKEKLLPSVDKLISQSKILQNQIERDISKRYKDRMVNLIGGFNNQI